MDDKNIDDIGLKDDKLVQASINSKLSTHNLTRPSAECMMVLILCSPLAIVCKNPDHRTAARGTVSMGDDNDDDQSRGTLQIFDLYAVCSAKSSSL